MECSILIDSGADRSIISLDFYNSIPRESLRSTNTLTAGKLSGVSGHNLEVMGEAQLEFKIGEQKFTHKFSIVKGVIRPALLGSDFLRTFGATLDYKNYTLTIGGFVVLCKQKGEIAQSRALIQTVDTVIIPPQSIMTIDVRANIPGYTGDYILIPYENAPVLKDQPGLLLPNMLVSNNSLLMSVINTTGREYTFRRGRVVGIAEGVDVVGEVAFVSTEDPPKPECPESEVLHVSNTSDSTSVARHGYNLRPRPQLGPPYLEQHSSRVPKRKLLETSATLPTAKVHRRDDSEQMDCDEVSSLSDCSGAHDNCGRSTKSWYEAVISYVVNLMLE